MKKLKWGLLTCLTVTSSVVPVLSTTSCGKKTEEVNKIGVEYDKEYGVDQAVYSKMKNEFWNKREIQLRSDPEITSEVQIERARQDLNETFSEYDNQLVSQQLSYTAVTNAMIDYASQTYGIRLTRTTSKKTATWDDLTAAFEGMVQSMNQYMVGSGVPETQRQIILDQARVNFVGNGLELENNPGLLPRIKAQYDDPLLGLIKAKAELLSCFSEMNYDIGLVAASNRLKNFMEDYEITYDKKDDQSNKLDKLEANDWFTVDADLSKESRILKIYTITRKADGKTLETFEPDKLCPSYTIKPILKAINKDARTNKYSLDIDWTCVKTDYLKSNDAEKVEKTTAHYFKPDVNELKQDSNITNAYDTLKRCNKGSTISYPVTLTKEGEAKAIADTYFNKESEDGYISFGWDTNPTGDKVNAFDALFAGMPLKDHINNGTGYEYLIDFNSLANSGLTISYNNAHQPARTTDPVRLDDLTAVNGAKSKSSVELLENQDQLVKDFIDNCSGWADTTTNETHTTNSGTYSATTSVYVDYQNTEYKPAVKTQGQYTSYCAVEDKEVNNYTISHESYDYLIGEYNTQNDFVSDYKKNKYKSEYNSAKNMSIVEGVFLSLTLLGCGLTVAKCAAPAFIAKIPVYIVIIILAILGTVGQIAMMSLNVDRKTRPLERFVKKLDKIKDSEEIDEFDNELIQSANRNNLPRYNQETHSIAKKTYEAGYAKYADKSDFFEEVLPTIEYYQNISQQSSFQHCHDIIEENEVDPETYLGEMETWDSNGGCTITYWTLFGVTLAFDLAVLIMLKKNPELSDWTAMKVAEAKARKSGQATESILKTYNEIHKVREELKALQKAARAAEKAGDFCTNTTKTLSAAEASQALELAEIGNGINSSERLVRTYDRSMQMVLRLDRMSSVTGIGEKMKEIAATGRAGLTRFMSELTAAGKGMKQAADASIFKQVFSSLDGAFKVAKTGGKFTSEFEHLQMIADAIRNLTPSAQTAVEWTLKTGKMAAQQGNFAQALSMIQSFDNLMFDISNWSKLGETIPDLVEGLDSIVTGSMRIGIGVFKSFENMIAIAGTFVII